MKRTSTLAKRQLSATIVDGMRFLLVDHNSAPHVGLLSCFKSNKPFHFPEEVFYAMWAASTFPLIAASRDATGDPSIDCTSVARYLATVCTYKREPVAKRVTKRYLHAERDVKPLKDTDEKTTRPLLLASNDNLFQERERDATCVLHGLSISPEYADELLARTLTCFLAYVKQQLAEKDCNPIAVFAEMKMHSAVRPFAFPKGGLKPGAVLWDDFRDYFATHEVEAMVKVMMAYLKTVAEPSKEQTDWQRAYPTIQMPDSLHMTQCTDCVESMSDNDGAVCEVHDTDDEEAWPSSDEEAEEGGERDEDEEDEEEVCFLQD